MKPIQVGLLVLAGAVAGGFIVRWQMGRNAVPAAAAIPAPTAPAAGAVQTTPAQAEPAQAQPPSPFPPEKPRKEAEVARKPRAAHRAEATTVAETREPAVAPPAAPATADVAAKSDQSVPPSEPETKPQPEPVAPAPLPPPPPRQVTLSSGMLIPARTVEGLSTERNLAGDTFTATLDDPLVVDGLVIAERGAHLEGKIVQSERAGKVKGLAALAIELTQLNTSDGQRVPIETETFTKHGQKSTGEDAAKVGAGAAIGAVIGAIAGGGKGAGIGAAVGGAAGAGDVMLTRGKPATLAPETRISFRLKNPVTITERR